MTMTSRQSPNWALLLIVGVGLTSLQLIDVLSSEVGSKQWAYEVIGLLIPVGFIVIGTVMLIRSRSEERDDD
jgi:FtsH-binding integral membrane protein